MVDPKTPNNLYLAIDDALYKSTNGGGQWQLGQHRAQWKESPRPRSLIPSAQAIFMLSPRLLPEASWQSMQGVLYKTVDGGGQWSAVNLGISTADAEVVAVDPSSPDNSVRGYISAWRAQEHE